MLFLSVLSGSLQSVPVTRFHRRTDDVTLSYDETTEHVRILVSGCTVDMQVAFCAFSQSPELCHPAHWHSPLQ